MAEIDSQNFEHSALERDIETLAIEVQEQKQKGAPDKEILKAAIGARIYQQPKKIDIDEKGGEAVPQNILPAYLRNSPAETRLEVEKLIDIAWHKGINAAAKEADKKGAFIMDAFHDTLTAKLYDEFKKRGLLK